MELVTTQVDGLEALELQDDRCRVLILPEVGAKMASLVCRDTGRDVMWRNPDRPYRRPDYGDAFEDHDISGFDDCFPNIGPGPYPDYPWQGIPLPDHGELWTIPWSWEFVDEQLHLWTYGVRFPYRIDKWVSSEGRGLLLRYRATNLAPYEFKCLFSAHPLFGVRPNVRVLLPEGVKVRVDWSRDFRLGPLCTEHTWPVTIDSQGDEVDLSVIGSGRQGFADKFYTTRLVEGWCALHDPESGDFVAFSFSPEEVPFVGVWINQGGWPLEGTASFNAALEPCTGYPDRLDIAAVRNEVGSVPAKGTLEWSLKLLAGRTSDVVPILRRLS